MNTNTETKEKEFERKQVSQWEKDHPLCSRDYCPCALHQDMCPSIGTCPYFG